MFSIMMTRIYYYFIFIYNYSQLLNKINKISDFRKFRSKSIGSKDTKYVWLPQLQETVNCHVILLFYFIYFFRSIIFILYIFTIYNLCFYRQNLFLVPPPEFYAIYSFGVGFSQHRIPPC